MSGRPNAGDRDFILFLVNRLLSETVMLGAAAHTEREKEVIARMYKRIVGERHVEGDGCYCLSCTLSNFSDEGISRVRDLLLEEAGQLQGVTE